MPKENKLIKYLFRASNYTKQEILHKVVNSGLFLISENDFKMMKTIQNLRNNNIWNLFLNILLLFIHQNFTTNLQYKLN